jgi:hypothetical protein
MKHLAHQRGRWCRCRLAPLGSGVDKIDVEFCFYDDARYATDADRGSHVLRGGTGICGPRKLPGGDRLEWHVEPGGYLYCDSPHGPGRVSSDTVATSHSRDERYGALGLSVRDRIRRTLPRTPSLVVVT